MKLAITHTLTLHLEAASRAVQHVLLSPANTSQQNIERWSIEMPGMTDAPALRDGFGNRAHLVSQTKISGKLIVTVDGLVATSDNAGVLGRSDTDPRASIFLRTVDAAPPDAELLEGVSAEMGRLALLHELMSRVHEASGAQALQRQDQGGSSQEGPDSAGPSSFINAARWLDIPARYVSGYLLDGDASRFHLWAEAWDNGLGWIGFDPALNICPTESHVRVATGLQAEDVEPVRCVPVPQDAVSHAVTITVLEDTQVPRT